MLSICPLSNVALKVAKSVADVPIRKLLQEGVRFSINSDDPEYLGGYILDNYVAVQEAFNLSKEEWRIICENSISGSWCDEQRKSDLLSMLLQVV